MWNHLLKLTACSSFSGVLPEDLQVFLQNVPKSGKKLKVQLGVNESKLGAAISEELGIDCVTGGAIPELMRGLDIYLF